MSTHMYPEGQFCLSHGVQGLKVGKGNGCKIVFAWSPKPQSPNMLVCPTWKRYSLLRIMRLFPSVKGCIVTFSALILGEGPYKNRLSSVKAQVVCFKGGCLQAY